MNLDDLFQRVTFAGSHDLPRDRHGLPVVFDDGEDEDSSRFAEFKENQGRDENGKFDPDGGHWTHGGGSDVVPRGWSKRYPGLKDTEDFHENDQIQLDPTWVENVIPEDKA